MSYVFATPEFLAAAASDLENILSIVGSANAAALGPTSGVLAAGADEVSASIAALFGAHAQIYQALSAQAALFHEQFVQLMSGGSVQYALTEAANASPLQTVEQGVMGGVGAPAQALSQGPSIGNGATAGLTTLPGPGAFGPGANGATAQFTGGVGPAAAAVGGPGGAVSFGPGGAGFAGALAAGENFGGLSPAGASSATVGSAGALEAAETAEIAAVPDTAVTPLAALPMTPPIAAPATAVRPATPAYSPAPAAAAEPSDD
jgi:hypothetical protein